MIRTWSNMGTRSIRAAVPPAAVGLAAEAQTALGAGAVNFVNDTVHQVQALPPEMLLLLAVVILAGLYVLKRAF
jgi:hypothetical protein